MALPGAAASPLRVMLRRNFWPYFVGNLLSNCGTWFQNLAQAIFVYRLTGSTLLVGLVNFAQFIGVFVLAPWAGSAADRFDRRRRLQRRAGPAHEGGRGFIGGCDRHGPVSRPDDCVRDPRHASAGAAACRSRG